jgi:WD40 repeat protein
VLVFDAASGQPRPPLKPPAGRGVTSADVSPDGRKLVTVEELSFEEFRRADRPGEFGVVRELATVLWDTRAATARPLAEAYARAAFSPDSRKLVVSVFSRFGSDEPGVLKLFDADGAELAEHTAGKGEVGFGRPDISPDGNLVAVYHATNRNDNSCVLRVFDLATLKEVAAFKPRGEFPFVSHTFSPDGRRLAATDTKDGVSVWDVATGKPVLTKSFVDELRVSNVAFVAGGRKLAVLGQPKRGDRDLSQPRVVLCDLAAPAAEPEVISCPPDSVSGFAVSPDGRTLAVGGTGAVHLFDLTDPPPARPRP